MTDGPDPDNDPRNAINDLFENAKAYRKSKDFMELLEFIKRFRGWAMFNAVLLHTQKPGSRYVTYAKEWRLRFNRYIKPGARPLVVLMPFCPVRFVYELGDTYGDDPFPEELLDPLQVEGEIPQSEYDLLIANMASDGVSYFEQDHAAMRGGSLEKAPAGDFQRIGGQKVKVHYRMVVNQNYSKEAKFAVVAHELGHLYCGHLGIPNKKWKAWPSRAGKSLNVIEFEAEVVSWLVCGRAGVNNPSHKYLSGYMLENEEIPKINIDVVLRAAKRIEDMLGKSFPLQKGLLDDKLF